MTVCLARSALERAARAWRQALSYDGLLPKTTLATSCGSRLTTEKPISARMVARSSAEVVRVERLVELAREALQHAVELRALRELRRVLDHDEAARAQTRNISRTTLRRALRGSSWNMYMLVTTSNVAVGPRQRLAVLDGERQLFEIRRRLRASRM